MYNIFHVVTSKDFCVLQKTDVSLGFLCVTCNTRKIYLVDGLTDTHTQTCNFIQQDINFHPKIFCFIFSLEEVSPFYAKNMHVVTIFLLQVPIQVLFVWLTCKSNTPSHSKKKVVNFHPKILTYSQLFLYVLIHPNLWGSGPKL